MLRPSLLWDITEVLGQPIGLIFKGHAVQKDEGLSFTAAETRNVAKYYSKSTFFVRP
jgi:hypothetical protein